MKRRPHNAAEPELLQRLEDTIADPAAEPDALRAVAQSPFLNEELARALLDRRDLNPRVIEDLTKNAPLMRGRQVRLAVASHQRAPRHVSLPLLKHLFTFDLMTVALLPQVAGDLKLAAEDALLARLSILPAGERLTLARRASGRIAAALLQDQERRVAEAAIHNPRLTEALLIRALGLSDGSDELAPLVCAHPQWPLRHDVQLALLRHAKTPLASAISFIARLSPTRLAEILERSQLPENIRFYLMRLAETRRTQTSEEARK